MSIPATFIEAFHAHRDDPSLIRFECKIDGEIEFLERECFNEAQLKRSDAVVINSIHVKTARKGIFLRFINQLIADSKVNEITFCGVSSDEMIDCFKHIDKKYKIRFVDHGGDLVWTRG